MVSFGIISDTHITDNDNPEEMQDLLTKLRKIFSNVDKIIHAGNIISKEFLEELDNIAPVECVKGHLDYIEDLQSFIKLTVGKYNIGVIHKLPIDLEMFFKKNGLQILIFGHTHQPLIKGTKYNTLLINPGSPTYPKAPQPKKGFEKPIPRPSVITLNIDENDILSTYIINLKS